MHMNPESRLLKNDPSCSNQRGYSLIELSIVLVITTGVMLGLFSIYQFKQATDKADIIAGQYKSINLAVSKYLSQNSDALLQLLNTRPACSDINWRASTNGVQGVTVNPDPTGCELRDAKGNILAANGAQPTLDELRTLRFLDATTPATVPMNTQQVMVANASSANQFVPSRFAVQITRTCVQHAGAVASAASYLNCSTTSTTGYWDLSSLVFNNQPFTEEAIFTSRGINLMNLIFNAAGTDALIAGRGVQAVTNANGVDITNQFPLIAANRSAGEFVTNPLRDPAGNGVANVLAMRGGYQSSLFLNRMRVDGGTRPTNDWNFAGFNVTDIGSLGVNKDIAASNDIRASNRIFAGKAGDPNCDVSSNQHGGGAGDINACRDMVAKGWVKGLETVVAGPNNDIGVRLNRDGSIQGKTLNVDSSKNVSNINNITQSGGIKSQGVIETTEDFITAAGKKVQAGYFKFLNTVAEGTGCVSDFTNSLTLDSVNQNKFLRCDGTTWVSMLQKGETGASGPPGASGPTGPEGPAYTTVKDFTFKYFFKPGLNSYAALRRNGNTLAETDNWASSEYFISDYKRSDYIAAFTSLSGTGGHQHSENYSVGAFNMSDVWSNASDQPNWAFLYRYLPAIKSSAELSRGIGFGFSFIPFNPDETEIKTGSIGASNPSRRVISRFDTQLDCNFWTPPIIKSITTAQYDTRNASYWSSCENGNWATHAEVDGTYIEVQYISMKFKGGFLPKTAILKSIKGVKNTEYSCSEWNRPIVVGWWSSPLSTNMQNFHEAYCDDNNNWVFENNLIGDSSFNADYLFISKYRYRKY